ncbi:hypothetical protein FOMG_02366 [Fusarium oxysporum f. sp. melonis 26406]|uniref:DUF6603 domain-containing protein n=1 Tax=Fusarium oxysporum f. sp. melonis 26406 TaxID=1089452 RepID=X0B9P8_FUSOX|nr:hypothetical protein FOMG_02366 [Fusarium oxysporum f. sp. melonis 26406]
MFTASGGINVGVRYTLDLWFVTIYINIQLGATLFLQGPPFQGVCHVNFWVFGFDIAFGPSDAVESPTPIQLLEFYRLTLQRQTATEEDSSKPHIFTCNSGLVSSMKPEPKDPKEVTKMAHDFVPNSDPPPPVWSVTAAITAPPVNKTEFGRTSREKSVWELRAVISSVPKALWDRYDPSKNYRSLLDPSGPATVDLMMGVQSMPPEAHSRDDRIKPFDAVKSQLEDVIKPINFPDTTKFQNDTWPPALPVKPTPDNPAKPWGTVRDLWSETNPRNPTEILPESIPSEMSNQGGQDLVAAQDENEEDDDDSALGEDSASSTASLTSSILEYRKFQGRTFNSDKYETEYFAPNDERQKESIDIS